METTDRAFIEQTIMDSFQKRSTGEQEFLSGHPIIGRLKLAGDVIAPWWSYARDAQLKSFWMGNDFLSGPMYAMTAKMQAIPFRIIPDDFADPEKVELAKIYTRHLYDSPEFGAGWEAWWGMWVQNLLGFDNGSFSEITGKGNPDGPIRGMPGTVQMLDSMNAQRTSVPLYPVIYNDTDGKRYKLHYTRVMFDSQLPSTQIDMNKVGLCAISRVINTGQNLLDLSIYKMEKLGSRPNRAIGITQGGLDPMDVAAGMEMANLEMTTQGLRRYSKLVVLGSSTLPDADLLIKDISSLPDGFQEKDSIILGMAVVALGFGVDARELFPAMQSGATRADALLSHIKQRGKGPGQIIQSGERLFSRKFLPPFLTMVFDYQDDTQDQQEAEIEKLRSERRQRDLETGVSDMRTERERMLAWGEIDQSQFSRLELEDGRLPDGTSVLSLFFSDSEMLGNMLENKFDNILDLQNNDPMEIVKYINERKAAISKMLANSRSVKKVETARQALSALKALEDEYMESVPEKPMQGPENRSYPLRRENLTTPNQKTELGVGNSSLSHSDDSPVVKGGSEGEDFFWIKSVSDYRTAINGSVRALWGGNVDVFDFSAMMAAAVRRGIRQGFIEGAREGSIEPGDFTEEEEKAIEDLIAGEIERIDNFGDAIAANDREAGGKLSDFDWRVDLWVARYAEAKTLGKVMAGSDKKQKWVIYSQEHCGDCSKLAGKVKRLSVWKRYDIYPRSHKLECMKSAHGVSVCKCELEDTDEPCTPGPLPTIS